jgi:hypothetical protein
MREKIPSSELRAIVERADTLRGAEILLEQEGLSIEAILPGPVASSERLIISDWGGDARGQVVFFEGARKAARRAARQEA